MIRVGAADAASAGLGFGPIPPGACLEIPKTPEWSKYSRKPGRFAGDLAAIEMGAPASALTWMTGGPLQPSVPRSSFV
jgi:hypothetical protein